MWGKEMVIDDDILSLLNKVAFEYKMPLKVIQKIYEEDIHYMEIMFSQHNIYDKSTHINFKYGEILTFTSMAYQCLKQRKKYEHIVEFDARHKKNELLRLERLYKHNKRYVKFINAIRKRRATKWYTATDETIQRFVAEVKARTRRFMLK